jgi:hypothetical protein
MGFPEIDIRLNFLLRASIPNEFSQPTDTLPAERSFPRLSFLIKQFFTLYAHAYRRQSSQRPKN